MALNELLHFPKVVPLIPGTGVQFLDFGFSVEPGGPGFGRSWFECGAG